MRKSDFRSLCKLLNQAFSFLTCKIGIKGEQDIINGFQIVLNWGCLEGCMPSGHIIPFLSFISSLLNVCFIQAQVLISPSPLLAVWSLQNYITQVWIFLIGKIEDNLFWSSLWALCKINNIWSNWQCLEHRVKFQ